MTSPRQLFKNWNYHFWIKALLALIAVTVLFSFISKCNNKTEIKTDQIKTEKQKKDSVKIIVKHDSVIVEKWRTIYKRIRQVDTIPCEQKLIVCDTIIKVDSTLINSLYSELSISNTILGLQDMRHANDSTKLSDTVRYYKRKVVRKTVKAFILGFTAGAAVGNTTKR